MSIPGLHINFTVTFFFFNVGWSLKIILSEQSCFLDIMNTIKIQLLYHTTWR